MRPTRWIALAVVAAAAIAVVAHRSSPEAAPPAPPVRADTAEPAGVPAAAPPAIPAAPAAPAMPVAREQAARPKDLVEVLGEDHADARAERRALDEALVASGPAGAWAADATARIDGLVAALSSTVGRGLAIADRRCHAAGCIVAIEYPVPSAWSDDMHFRDLAGLGQWQGGTIQTIAVADDRGVLTQAFILLPPPGSSL